MTLPGPNRFKPREPWERDLYLLWLAIVLTMVGFGGVFPFLPLYIRELGIEDPRQAALWGGIVGSVTGLLMAFSAPLWGVIGDRSGRRKNVVRGTFGFAVLMFSASFVPNVYCLLGLWLFLGLLPGPSMAAMPVVTGDGAQAPHAVRGRRPDVGQLPGIHGRPAAGRTDHRRLRIPVDLADDRRPAGDRGLDSVVPREGRPDRAGDTATPAC